MTPDKQAVIFDWNGVIPDDAPLFCAATNKILSMLGSPQISLERYREVYDVPVNNTYKMLGCSEDRMKHFKHEMVEVWRDHYEANVEHVCLREGVPQMLQEIKAMGHRTAILSNYVRDSISKQALSNGVHHYFDEILAREHDELKNVMNGRGKGDRLQAFIAKHGLTHGIIVGDSPEEMEIARHYGQVSVGISGGCCSASRIRAAKPDFMINSLTEMPEIVRRVFAGGRGK